MKTTYPQIKYETTNLREIEIFSRTGRNDILVESCFRSKNLHSALFEFYRLELEPCGFRDPIRTGNVLSVTGTRKGDVFEFAARDKA